MARGAGRSPQRADALASAGSLGTVAGRSSLQSHGQFDVVSERNRKIIAGFGPDAAEVFRAVIRVVGNDENTAAQATLKQRKYGRIETLRPTRRFPSDQSDQRAGDHGARIARPVPPMLDAEASATLRDQLAAELEAIGSAEEAATWAHRVIGTKARLVAADAKRIESAFQERLARFDSVNSSQPPRKRRSATPIQPTSAGSIDKSELAYPEPRRVRDREHVRFVAKQPCLICGRKPSDPHHLRFTQHRALNRKVSDEFTVPPCRGHHREVHRCGEEAAWWQKAGVDPAASARTLWLQTHPLLTRPANSVEDARARGAAGADLSVSNANRLIASGGPNDKTRPIVPAPSR